MKSILYKFMLTVCFFFTLIFLTSCNNKYNIGVARDKLIFISDNIKDFKLKEFTPVMKQNENIIIKNFNTEMIVFSTFYSPEISDKDNISQYFYKEGKTVNIGSTKSGFISSGSKIERNNILYTTDSINSIDSLQNIIYKIDIKNKQINKLIEIKDMLPLSYIFNLNENYILYYCVSLNDNKYHYYINKINLNNNEIEAIVECEYEQTKRTGKIISCVNTFEEKIYAYVLIDRKPFVEIYDINGKLIKNIQLEIGEDELESDAVFTIGIIDNIAILSTLKSNVMIFEINENSWSRMDSIPYFMNPIIESYDNYNSNNIYFVDSYNPEILYVLDINTKEFKKYIIKAEDDSRYVEYYQCDNYGNILVWTYDKKVPKDFNYYLIENSKIN